MCSEQILHVSAREVFMREFHTLDQEFGYMVVQIRRAFDGPFQCRIESAH